MLSIFVTGGIGSGKSTLMEFLKEKGAGIVLADEVGHENLHDSEMKAELVKAFGKEILDTNGEIIRSELAARASCCECGPNSQSCCFRNGNS